MKTKSPKIISGKFFWDDEIDLFLNLAEHYLFKTYVTTLLSKEISNWCRLKVLEFSHLPYNRNILVDLYLLYFQFNGNFKIGQ